MTAKLHQCRRIVKALSPILILPSIFKDRPRIRMTVVPDFTALMMMTDGVSDAFFDTDTALATKENWEGLWSRLSEKVDFNSTGPQVAQQLLEWLDFWSTGNHDDRTIAILY